MDYWLARWWAAALGNIDAFVILLNEGVRGVTRASQGKGRIVFDHSGNAHVVRVLGWRRGEPVIAKWFAVYHA